LDLRYYQSSTGQCPFVEWLGRLGDQAARAKVQARLARVAAGNLGDFKSVGGGVLEMRIDWGPGYRIYFSRDREVVVLLLCAGDKRTQHKDIQRAKTYLDDYQARVAKAKRQGSRP